MKRCLQCHTRFETDTWTCPACCFSPRCHGEVPVFAPALADGDGSDAEYRYERLAEAEARHFWFVGRAMLISWALQKYFPAAQSFLEVGCGTGGVSAAIGDALPVLRMTASDARLSGLEYATRFAPRFDVIQCDAYKLPFDSEFDVVGAFDVIEHLDDDVAVLAAMRDVVRPGGGLLITVPQHQWLWSQVDEFSCHRRRYARADLRAKLIATGLEVVRTTSFVASGLPILWLSRRFPQPFDPEREMRISPFANALMAGLFAIERRLIAAGVSLPFGASLLAVARRPE